MVNVGRLITAMVTPFDGQGEVDYDQAKHLASSLLDSGSDGLVVSGTTGESPTLTKEEKLRLFREIKAELGDRGAVVAGTGNYSTAESIELTREAEKEGADAALLVVPYYNKPPQDGLYLHFKAIAESTGLPCILYNVPSRTITNLSAETTLRLSQVPNIIGVKEASADFDQIATIIEGADEGFQVWSGNLGGMDRDTRQENFSPAGLCRHAASSSFRGRHRQCPRGCPLARVDRAVNPLDIEDWYAIERENTVRRTSIRHGSATGTRGGGGLR